MSVNVTAEPRQSLGDLESLALGVIDGEPAWLTDVRRKALDWVVGHGFPARKHEDWRYVDLRPLLEMQFSATSGDIDVEHLAAMLGTGLGGPRLVLVNGRFAPELSFLSEVPAGIRVGPTSGGLDRRDVWLPVGGLLRDGFEALNTALAVDGALVEIGPDVTLDIPIEIVHLAYAAGDPVMSHPRTLIRVGAASRVTIVETYFGGRDGTSFTNSQNQVLLDDSSQLEHYRFQADSDTAYHLSSVSVRPGRASRFASHLLATGSHVGRHELRVLMAEPGAGVDLDGLYLTGGDRCHDNPVRVEHAAPDCFSRQVFRGIVDDSGHGIFNGHVIVHPGANGTDAQQVNKNLLLSEHAEVDTRPRLEIFADDVACTHGAAVGQLDPEALFYLRSRGISEPHARVMLVAGFAEEILTRFQPGPIRDRAEQLVAARLEGGQR